MKGDEISPRDMCLKEEEVNVYHSLRITKY